MEKEDYFLMFLWLAIMSFAIYVTYVENTAIIKEKKRWDKKLEKCELNSFDDNDQTYKFICQDNIEIYKKKISNEQWENIKEKNNCKIISYNYVTRIKTWSCNNGIIVKNEFE